MLAQTPITELAEKTDMGYAGVREGTQFVMLAMCGRFTRMPGFWSCSRLFCRS
jgi:hypothetical protein